MNFKLWNVVGILIITVVMIGFALTDTGGGPVRIALSLPFVLALPGYALMLAIFPLSRLETAERIALTLGTSLVVAALSGLALHWSAWGLHPVSWSVFLGCITLLASAVALARWRDQANQPPPNHVSVQLRLSLQQALLFALAGIVALGAFALAYLGETQQKRAPFTQLWIQPRDETYEIGVHSYEDHPIQFRLRVDANGQPVLSIPSILLAPGETWTTLLEDDLTEAETLQAQLFRLYVPLEACAGDAPADGCERNNHVYRQVVLRN